MTNKTLKTIIKHLARANTYAAQQALRELPTQADKAEAKRIFEALHIKTEQTTK